MDILVAVGKDLGSLTWSDLANERELSRLYPHNFQLR